MKNWMLAVAGLFLFVGLTFSEAAKAEFPGMVAPVGVGVNVNVGYQAPVPFFPAPMPMGAFSHGIPGAAIFPPPFYPRPYCAPVIGYGFRAMVPYCFPPRPRRRHFALAIRIGGFGFAINTGNSYY